MEIIKLQLGPASAYVVDSSSKALRRVFQLRPGWNLALRTVYFNVRRERLGDMELVRIRVGRLSRFEIENLSRSQLIILLRRIMNIKRNLVTSGTYIRVEVVLVGSRG